jgi:hypothetical protein
MNGERPPQSWQVTSAAYPRPAPGARHPHRRAWRGRDRRRIQPLRDALHVPSVGSSSRRFELQLDSLARYARSAGGVDCLVFGNSSALMGVDPEALSRAYQDGAGKPLRCFNFGVGGMTASAAGAVAPIIARRYRPQLLIYVASPRDLAASAEGPLLAGEPWVRCQAGDCSASGWFASHSAAFGYYLLYRQWLDPLRWPAARSPAGTTASGFWPLDGHLTLSPTLWEHTQEAFVRLGNLSAPEVDGFSRLLQLTGDGMEVVVVESPVHPRLRRWARGASPFFDETMARMRAAARERQVPFWRAPIARIVPGDDWVDFVHLDRDGAGHFSSWLGARLAAAVRDGQLADPHAAAPSR